MGFHEGSTGGFVGLLYCRGLKGQPMVPLSAAGFR